MDKENCKEILPGVKFCVTQAGSTITVELDFFGHRVFRASLTEDHPCVDAHVSVFFGSATFKACVDFDHHEVTFDGRVCVVGKCVDVDFKLSFPA